MLCACRHPDTVHALEVGRIVATGIRDPTISPNHRGECHVTGCPCAQFTPRLQVGASGKASARA